jgi:hypothetical protein
VRSKRSNFSRLGHESINGERIPGKNVERTRHLRCD